MNVAKLTRDAVLRIGEVCEVAGRRVYILVDKNKNLSDMFFEGDILKNISVNSYIEIRKGFLSLIGRVEGEKIEEEFIRPGAETRDPTSRSNRILTVSLSGYIDEEGTFTGGTRELPLIGNEAYIVTKGKIHILHNLVDTDSLSVTIASVFGDDIDVAFPVDGLFNSHIAIFGNTGSGKSNTLAYLYQELYQVLHERNADAFADNAHFLLYDFNGEYASDNCITAHKKVYSLSTRSPAGADKIPIDQDALFDSEVVSVLADATEKTQKPFISRALNLHSRVYSEDVEDPADYLRNILRTQAQRALRMTDKPRAHAVLDAFRDVLAPANGDGEEVDVQADLEWHNTLNYWKYKPPGGGEVHLGSEPDRIVDTELYRRVGLFEPPNDAVSRILTFLHVQLIYDVLDNRAQSEHIGPPISRLYRKRRDIEKLFETDCAENFWQSNFVVINLDDVNLDMKKTIPLLLSKTVYAQHKRAGNNKSLNIIVDEAHNILSTESFREAESWKDYRLETFEEIIKEGRKFGVFVTIASQRPNDISPTISSQAHNYFIHRLINQKDLATISSAVSYIDRVTEESIPTLPTGTCVFSGVASQMPLKINVKPLDENLRPQSATRKFSDIVPPAGPDDLAWLEG